jgi:N-acetylglutamate synthase and related acetyltransferases
MSMAPDVSIRPGRPDEKTMLESLQWRASLGNPGDREAILANPDAIELPIDQIAAGCVFVAEREGDVAGFAAVVPRPDGGAELDALFVEPHLWKHGIGRRLVDHIAEVAREGRQLSARDRQSPRGRLLPRLRLLRDRDD